MTVTPNPVCAANVICLGEVVNPASNVGGGEVTKSCITQSDALSPPNISSCCM